MKKADLVRWFDNHVDMVVVIGLAIVLFYVMLTV